MTVAIHLDCYVDGLKKRCLVDAGEDEVSFVEGFGTLGRGTDANGGDWFADRQEETRFLWKSAGVAHYREGVHL